MASSTPNLPRPDVQRLARALRLAPDDAQTLCTKMTDPEVGTNFDATLLQALGRAIRSSLPRRAQPGPHPPSWAVAPLEAPDPATVRAYLSGHDQPQPELACHSARTLAPGPLHLLQALGYCLYWLSHYLRADGTTRRLLRSALPHAVAARRVARMAAKHHVSRIILWGHLYAPFQLLLSRYAQQAHIPTLACESGMVYAPRLAFAADEIWLPQPWGVREALAAGMYRAPTIRIAHSHDYYRPRGPGATAEQRQHQIAFYSSGSYLRGAYSFDSSDFLTLFQHSERRILDAMLNYARAYPQLAFSIKLHPIEKKPPHRPAVEAYFAEALTLSNVRLGWDPAPSRDSYTHYELGLGFLSTTLYERLELGLKSVFLYTAQYPSAPVHSALRHAMYADPDRDQVVAWLESMRSMSAEQFHTMLETPATYLAGQLTPWPLPGS